MNAERERTTELGEEGLSQDEVRSNTLSEEFFNLLLANQKDAKFIKNLQDAVALRLNISHKSKARAGLLH